jgi:hypothetical protein
LSEFLSHQELLIAIAPMAAMGFLVGFVGLFIVWRDRRKAEQANRQAAGANSVGATPKESKAAHA